MPLGFLHNLDLSTLPRGVFARGDVVISCGQETDRLILLQKGSVKIGKLKLAAPNAVLMPEFFALDQYRSTAIATTDGFYYAAPRAAVKHALDQSAPITWPLARAAAGERIMAHLDHAL